MKNGRIFKLCKDRRQVVSVMYDGTQWIGDGRSLFPLYNSPIFTKETLLGTYDVPDKKQSEILYKEVENFEGVSLDDYLEEDIETERLSLVLDVYGYNLNVYLANGEIYFIDRKYLSVFDEEEIYLFRRKTATGKMCFVAKAGFVIMGIIMPVDVVSESFVRNLELLHTMTKKAFECKDQDKPCEMQESLLEEDLI